MGQLYDKMARDLALKNLAPTTQKEYLRCCSHFVRYHMTSPAELGETAIKQYLEHLLLKGAEPETLKMNVAALKFLYGVTLDRPKVDERIPWPKVDGRLDARGVEGLDDAADPDTAWRRLRRKLYRTKWVSYAKPPFAARVGVPVPRPLHPSRGLIEPQAHLCHGRRGGLPHPRRSDRHAAPA